MIKYMIYLPFLRTELSERFSHNTKKNVFIFMHVFSDVFYLIRFSINECRRMCLNIPIHIINIFNFINCIYNPFVVISIHWPIANILFQTILFWIVRYMNMQDMENEQIIGVLIIKLFRICKVRFARRFLCIIRLRI